MSSVLFHLVVFLVPFRRLRSLFLNALGHQVAADARVGMIVLIRGKLTLAPGARIAPLSYFNGVQLLLGEGSSIGSFNVFRGAFDVVLRY